MANSTLDRIGDIVRSNMSELLDRLEDPEKLARQLLRDMEVAVEQAVESVSRAIADKGRIEREYESARLRVESYGEKARRAFEKGDEDLARKALELKVYYDVATSHAQAAVEEGGQTVAQLKSRLAQLREELKTAREGQGRLIAGIQVKAGASSPRSTDRFNEVQRLQDRLERNRSELERLRVRIQRDDDAGVTEAATEFDSDSLERRFADLEVHEKVEKEMGALRQKANLE